MNYKELVYLDIETTSRYPDLDSLKENDERGYELFLKKIERRKWEGDPNILYKDKSPLLPEFGKIICVTFGLYVNSDEPKIVSYYDDDEKVLITKVKDALVKIGGGLKLLSGFYIKWFDIPFIVRTLIKYNIEVPNIIKTFNKKPWEMATVDLSEVWNSHSTLENVSFDEMLYTLGVPSPKDVISGKEVQTTYWDKKDLDTIVKYCEKDVIGCINAAKKIVHLI